MQRHPVADWQELSALYETADALDGAALDGWLAGLQAKSHPLLGQLQQMLAACSKVRGNGFLATLPALPVEPEPLVHEWLPGSRVGPYRLIRHVGQGGMAEVWLAQRDDGAFRRQVAIKLLFRTASSTQRDSFAQRFARERDILASLNHPHIAALHDAGVTPSGQPWLALEYVEGEPLTVWCDKTALNVEGRVRLFRQVLLAVQHAHANLVIHRDLKPGNILVTAQGEVRLLDFGIAKLVEAEGTTRDETELTRVAGRPLTPQYASPEQLLGEALTTASDVYSLGVVLYELLCGQRPYELKMESAAQLEQAIVDLDPRAPSRRTLSDSVAAARGNTAKALHKRLAGDLDAITLRALAKQPERRYASVEALRVDLDRWLAGEPVQATPPGTAYRLAKFALRHRWGVGLGASAVLSLIGVAAVAVVMGLQAREESARAVAARDFMLNIFQRADQEKSRGADITARDLLETGRKDVLTRLAGQPRLQAELLRGIAKIQESMGEYATADSTYAELVRIHSELKEPREEAMTRADHAINAARMNNLVLAGRLLQGAEAVPGRPSSDAELNARLAEAAGWIALNAGDLQRARDLLAAARQTAIQALGADHLRSFRLGQALFRAERDLSHFDTALSLQSELRQSAGRVQGLDPGEVGNMDWENVNLLFGAGRFAQAFAMVEVALPRCVEALGPQEQSCRFLFLKRAQTLLRLGRLDAALQELPRLQSMANDASLPFLQIEALLLEFRLRSMVPDAPELPSLFERVRAFGQSGGEVAMKPTFKAAALFALADHRLRSGDAAEAGAWAEKGLAVLGGGALQGGALRIAATGRMLTGVALMQNGLPEPSLAQLSQAQADCARALGAEHPTTQLYALNTALALAALQRGPEALAVVRQAEPILRGALGADSPTYQGVLALLQRLETATGKALPADTIPTRLQRGPNLGSSVPAYFS
ncbi:MAG: serine/threonine-protein kinase [Burkholderiaceae bacterium]